MFYDLISTAAAVAAGLFLCFLFGLLLRVTGTVRYIPNDRIGVVEKLWSPRGSVKAGLLALNGEAGFQPELRRGGFHFFGRCSTAFTSTRW